VQLEALLTVHDPRVVQPEVGVDDRALVGEAEVQRGEEGRRRDAVGMAEGARGRRVGAGRVLVADRLGEAADVLPPHLEAR
jgi:hypothetical protein